MGGGGEHRRRKVSLKTSVGGDVQRVLGPKRTGWKRIPDGRKGWRRTVRVDRWLGGEFTVDGAPGEPAGPEDGKGPVEDGRGPRTENSIQENIRFTNK